MNFRGRQSVQACLQRERSVFIFSDCHGTHAPPIDVGCWLLTTSEGMYFTIDSVMSADWPAEECFCTYGDKRRMAVLHKCTFSREESMLPVMGRTAETEQAVGGRAA